MRVHAQLGFFREALHRQTGLVNHQRAAKAQRHNSGGSCGHGQDRGYFREESLAIITGDGSSNRDQSGCGKQSQTRVKNAQRPKQQLCAGS